ncbi:MAG TPA: class I SAM-dependent methyltransferase [Nitrospirae bacterium]|nr:class I SAM-dependent methyltransferase [Nitrospirota bacterium]HDO26034.1 class I SAM-dependent methyltransferase [Nitrospirota bacterium]
MSLVDQSYSFKYHKLEENHWWFIGRRDIISELVKDFRRDAETLEIGCSGGVLIEALKRHGFTRLQGIDIDEEAVKICRQKGLGDINFADAENTEFNNQQFDVLIASDVLEHIRDEERALQEWQRILKSGGKLIIFVPAFQFLWSGHDEANRHYRRYRRSGLIRTLEKNGFKTDRASYWNLSLFLPVSAARLFRKIFPGSKKTEADQLFEVNPFINKILVYVLKLENKLLSWDINLPLGVSVFAVATRL